MGQYDSNVSRSDFALSGPVPPISTANPVEKRLSEGKTLSRSSSLGSLSTFVDDNYRELLVPPSPPNPTSPVSLAIVSAAASAARPRSAIRVSLNAPRVAAPPCLAGRGAARLLSAADSGPPALSPGGARRAGIAVGPRGLGAAAAPPAGSIPDGGCAVR